MGFSETSILIKIALIISIMAFLLHIVGFSTVAWVTFGESGFGLWKLGNGDETFDISKSGVTNSFKTVRAYECLGLIVGIVCIILILVYMFVKTEKMIKVLSAVTGIVAGVLIFIGVTIFTTLNGIELASFGYSFGLTIVGGILYVASGVLILLDGTVFV